MASTATPIDYPAGDGETICKGVYYTPVNASSPLPLVLICGAWDGLVQEVHDKAAKLADEGFIAFAIDVYGNGHSETDFTKLEATLGPYMADRGLLTQRMLAAVDAAKTISGADRDRMAAMGYCFGGTAVLDLARSGVQEIKGVVSFHGGLAGNDVDNPETIEAKILALHGADDPLVPPEQVAEFKAEMNSKNVDWQLHAYSQTVHAFTRPEANNPDFGAVYNARSDRRSWQAMLNFFAEIL